MGARGWIGVTLLALLAGPARAAAETVAEPIARLTLEGGYDSNVLYDGTGGDRTGRISPELGLTLRDPLQTLTALYTGDYLVFDRVAPRGIWNHRALIRAIGGPERRLTYRLEAGGGWAFDPVGLAQMGVLRAGEHSAWTASARGRLEYELAPRVAGALTLTERAVVFDDGTGGAMHGPGAEALYLLDRRLALGAAYTLGVFQSFERARDTIGFSNGARARLRYRATRSITLEAHAGPALWSGPKGLAFVPEVGAELLWVLPEQDLRVGAAHGLGIGSTARPGLVDTLEFGFVRRFGRTYDLRGDGGVWHSGDAPSGANAVWSYALVGEAGMRFGTSVRVALRAARYARLDDRSSALARTIIGLRLGWSLEPERPRPR